MGLVSSWGGGCIPTATILAGTRKRCTFAGAGAAAFRGRRQSLPARHHVRARPSLGNRSRAMALQRQKQTRPVVAFLNSGSRSGFTRPLAAFHRGLKEAGYKGQDVAVEFTWANGKVDQLPALAAGLFRRRVDLVTVTGGITPARAAVEARNQAPGARDVPLVFSGCDPDEVGLVNDFERPDRNATGVD